MDGPRRTELAPSVREVLDAMAAQPRPHRLPLDEARRRRADAIEAAATDDPRPVGDVADYRIPGPDGSIPIRVYTPEGSGPHPILVWLHGGGWVFGGLAGSDRVARAFTADAGCATVTVDYRLAPEHPFPAALEDAYAAVEWIAEDPAVASGDASRVAVGGASAGGNLAAAVPLLARARGGPALAWQFVVTGCLDASLDTASYEENATGYGLTRDGMAYYWGEYLRDDVDAANPLAAPAEARTLAGLPRATVVTTGFDPMRDEGIAYAERLDDDGVPVEHRHYPDMAHHITVLYRQGVGRAEEIMGELVGHAGGVLAAE